MTKQKTFATAAVIFCVMTIIASAVPVAFPGAEGAGRFSAGGRGGTVYAVTNLNNSGAGSIVDAVSEGNRTIVFRVSGTIDLGGVILRPKSNTTIAGQTAPGDGICLKGRIMISNNYSNIIIRYIRIRVDEGGANSSGDAIDIASGSDIIIDHVSASYARDETISCQPGSNNVTVQWCILSEALTFENHSYGALVRGRYGEQKSYHHNLFIHNKGRNPRPGNYLSAAEDPDGLYFDFRNNVIYNWSGTHPGNNYDAGNISRYNFINNVYIRGPGSSGTKIFGEYSIVTHGFFSGNAHGTSYWTVNVPSDPWSLVTFSGFTTAQINAYKARTGGVPVPMEPVTTTTALQALDDVLASAGASLVRDVIDTRLVSEVISGTGSYVENTGDLADPWPTLSSTTAPLDSDNDGMPDAWEIANGLNPNNAADRNYYTLHLDYTNLEVYLNSLVNADLEAPAAPTGLTAEADETVIALGWNANSEPDLAGYFVYRSLTSGSNYVKLNTLPLVQPTYQDDNVTPGTPYYYRVTAIDTSANESPFSSQADAEIEPPRIPGDITGDGKVNIEDLFGFLDLWLHESCDIPTYIDTNDDCIVNLEDFVVLSANWLEGTNVWEIETLQIQENEPGFITLTGTIDNNNAGFTGTGFANPANTVGSYIEWAVNAPVAGIYNLRWRYANGTAVNRTVQIAVNDSAQASGVAFFSTGSWTTWALSPTVSVTLAKGNNRIRMIGEVSDGPANIDWMEVTGPSPTPGN